MPSRAATIDLRQARLSADPQVKLVWGADVSYGSNSALRDRPLNVRVALDSGHSAEMLAGPSRAKSSH
jgi:hypothetical protein